MQLLKTPNPIGRVNGTRLRMLRKILADGMQTVAELADALDIEQRAVRDNATQAIQAGLLEKCLDGVTKTLAYRLTKAGREYVLRREPESAESARDNAAAESTASNTPTEQAPDEVETAPIQAADTQQECEAEQPCGEDCAEPPPATAPSDMLPDKENAGHQTLSTAEMLRVIKAITEAEYLAAGGIDPFGAPPETTEEPVAGAPHDAPQERLQLSLAGFVDKLRSTGAYAFARFENGRAVVEWITQTADDAFNELETSNRDAIVFKLTPVAMAERTVTILD